MYSNLKKLELYAFATGETIPIEAVDDQVFASKSMGDGIAIVPTIGAIHAPCKGKITMLMGATKHAVGIETKEGFELLLHIGLETVKLEGQGFNPIVQVGDEVNIGDMLIQFDMDYLHLNGINPLTLLIVINHYQINNYVHHKFVEMGKDKILEC